jgi:hypothetical protein
VLEEEKCRVKTYQDAAKSLKELQEFAVQRNDSDMLGVILRNVIPVVRVELMYVEGSQ